MVSTPPVWGADCPISMPMPSGDPVLVPMFGFAMSQFRLVHDITAAEYEAMAVPIYAPVNSATAVADDAALDAVTVPTPAQPQPSGYGPAVVTGQPPAPGAPEILTGTQSTLPPAQSPAGAPGQPPPPPPGLFITSSTVTDGAVSIIYSAIFTATGGLLPLTWSGTALPPGLSVSSGGTLSGTPTTPGTYPMQISVTDGASPPNSATGIVTIIIQNAPPPPPPLAITTPTLATGTVGDPYDDQAGASGGKKPYTWGAT